MASRLDIEPVSDVEEERTVARRFGLNAATVA
jgi:hypothetical protein